MSKKGHIQKSRFLSQSKKGMISPLWFFKTPDVGEDTSFNILKSVTYGSPQHLHTQHMSKQMIS